MGVDENAAPGGPKSGPGVGGGAGGDGFLLKRNKAPRPINPMTASPPTTPPTMAPTGVGEASCEA